MSSLKTLSCCACASARSAGAPTAKTNIRQTPRIAIDRVLILLCIPVPHLKLLNKFEHATLTGRTLTMRQLSLTLLTATELFRLYIR